jgi:hypothetical protein
MRRTTSLDAVDAAARICDPIYSGVNEGRYFMVNYLKIMLSRSGNSHLIFLWLFPLSTIGINLRLNSFHTLAYI